MTTRNFLVAGFAGLLLAFPAAALAARVTPDIPPPQKRQSTLATAERLAQRKDPEPLAAELPSPFNPATFDQPDVADLQAAQAAARGTPSAVPVPVAPPGDRETLEKLASQITPSGMIMRRGAALLIMGAKQFEVGTRFTASFNNQDYELELVAIDRTTFTLRYRGEETTRPIKLFDNMNTRTPQIIVLALLAALPALRVQAQQPAATPPADAPAAAAPADAAATVTVTKADDADAAAATRTRDLAGRDTLSVDFPDEDIRNILRNVADLFELNIIMPDTLQGKTTIKLRDVTWRQIFQSVLQPVNYSYVEEGNIIKIVSNESLLQEPTSTDVFLINYARAADILPTVNSLVDPAAGGKIVVDTRSNSLVITERPSRMNRIRPIIEQLDRATDQVMIESKFVEVSDTDVKNIGVNWSSLAGYQLGIGGIQNEYLRNRDSVSRAQNGNTSLATQGSNNEIRDTNGTTRDSTQRNGSTTSSTVTSSGSGTLSTSSTGTTGELSNSSTQTNGSVTTGTTLNNISNTIDNLSSLLNTGGTSRALSAVFSASDFNLVLSALQSLQKTKVVSNPTIVTLNNTQAVINVGQERPIPNYTYNSERGVYEVSGFTYRPIGVILKVTPQVNSRGFIKLTVEPEVSQSNRDANFNGAAIPIVESRKANTTVSLKDGFTMGIGGLMQSQSNNGSNKVPVLGSIPVLGRLFKSDSRNMESTNLIIFITAKTISAEGAPVEQVFDSERVRGLDLRREDLPGHRDGSNPFISSMPKTPAQP